ncbi:MAG TPA: phosphate ABC transporter permease PstA [Candidatus Hydrothermia bacterium]|nr:phosphate ABC transporter permease PstA [Candidatus Hydrothermae bacterium]MDD3648777.1 phosphate ABC transporter permease PstA [Candidatus Hydrothermia bacterium]MDD5572892.1 phosphate ABC transporter permease PstA [Candidatus Hydrothermia bacterium]HOK23282.1 phosphate ABC transporter permease PstA [Candidatus Hydrothermia bacterium]HOL24091.1 phosphate ABC transporter permease PstA [Candidatus Hydrothermia bacterium]
MSIKTRKKKDKIFTLLVMFLSILTILPLFLILLYLIKAGFSALNLDLITKVSRPIGERGGALNSIIGTLIISLLATLIATPISVFTGLFIFEYRKKVVSKILNITVRLISGIPSIIIGIVVYLWMVKPLGKYSALSGSVALAIMMIPNTVTSTVETLEMIPIGLREASLALGASFAKNITKVILPLSIPGILTGVLIGLGRIAGETAPLLFTAFGNPFLNLNIMKPMDTLPLLIYNYALSPFEEWHKIAWGASLILIFIVLILNVLAKWIVSKWNR